VNAPEFFVAGTEFRAAAAEYVSVGDTVYAHKLLLPHCPTAPLPRRIALSRNHPFRKLVAARPSSFNPSSKTTSAKDRKNNNRREKI
jgi:hypothetical protein